MRIKSSPYWVTASKAWRRLSSIFSPRELAIYKATGERRLKAEIVELKARTDELPALRAEHNRLNFEVEKWNFALRMLADHERAELSDHLLTNYCRVETLRGGKTIVNWPNFSHLSAISEHVQNYLKFTNERVRRPRVGKKAFKRFELFDRRVPTVRLVDQVNELVQRALDCLGKDAQVRDARPLTLWLWLIGHPRARELLRFDQSARYAVRQAEQRIARERAQAKRESARKRQARCRIRVRV
jgi:hypothetical protein